MKQKYECVPCVDSDSGSGVHICSLDPDEFQNVTKTSLSKNVCVLKFSRRSNKFFPRCKMTYLTMLKSPGSGSRGRWIPKFNHFVPGLLPSCVWSLVKIAVQLWPVECKQTNKHTNRQTQLTKQLAEFQLATIYHRLAVTTCMIFKDHHLN